MKMLNKYKPLIIALFLTILAFVIGYTSNNMPENVARSYLASALTESTPEYKCNQIKLSSVTETKKAFQAEYHCKMIAKDKPVKWISGTVVLKKVPYTWKVIQYQVRK